MEMISVTAVFTSSDMVASSRYQTLSLDLTDRSVSSTARANGNGPSGLPWMPVADSIGEPLANTMLGLL